MWEARDGYLSAYSKGMRQRILILAAMLHDPDLLICNEPFSGLGVNTALLFRRLMQALANKGKMIFFSTHVFEVVEKLCTDVVILYLGAFFGFVTLWGEISLEASTGAAGSLIWGGILLALWSRLAMLRISRWQATSLRFGDDSDPDIRTLGLNE